MSAKTASVYSLKSENLVHTLAAPQLQTNTNKNHLQQNYAHIFVSGYCICLHWRFLNSRYYNTMLDITDSSTFLKKGAYHLFERKDSIVLTY